LIPKKTEEQSGFRVRRCKIDNIFTLNIVKEKDMVLIDLKTTHDIVPIEILWKKWKTQIKI
jgi:hypothetical protein